jgi:hypothetical protein
MHFSLPSSTTRTRLPLNQLSTTDSSGTPLLLPLLLTPFGVDAALTMVVSIIVGTVEILAVVVVSSANLPASASADSAQALYHSVSVDIAPKAVFVDRLTSG